MILIKASLKFGKWAAMTIFPFIIIKNKFDISAVTIRHESIHLAQQKELSILALGLMLILIWGFKLSLFWILFAPLFFYFWYVIEWFIRSLFMLDFRLLGRAYHDISFEREAYCNEIDKDYLKNRKPFAFIAHLY